MKQFVLKTSLTAMADSPTRARRTIGAPAKRLAQIKLKIDN
jgi:hypothetical protein